VFWQDFMLQHIGGKWNQLAPVEPNQRPVVAVDSGQFDNDVGQRVEVFLPLVDVAKTCGLPFNESLIL
jgi:hypothetical protein